MNETNKNENLFKVIFTMLLLATGGTIVWYYWSVETILEIQRLPVYFKVAAFGYIFTQIIKRYAIKTTNWWDWLYYIGLLCSIIPPLMITQENSSMFMILAEYGTLFLIIPALLDGRSIMQKK